MPVDPERLCDCTVGCKRSKVECRRAGIVCRYKGGTVMPDSFFVVGGDPTPRRELRAAPVVGEGEHPPRDLLIEAHETIDRLAGEVERLREEANKRALALREILGDVPSQGGGPTWWAALKRGHAAIEGVDWEALDLAPASDENNLTTENDRG